VLAEQRRRAVARLVDESGGMTVGDLVSVLAVSPSTISRDLVDLARRGRLVRVHGGAVSISLDASTSRAC
jgi:DeoR family fructose operon transcriptional repressor